MRLGRRRMPDPRTARILEAFIRPMQSPSKSVSDSSGCASEIARLRVCATLDLWVAATKSPDAAFGERKTVDRGDHILDSRRGTNPIFGPCCAENRPYRPESRRCRQRKSAYRTGLPEVATSGRPGSSSSSDRRGTRRSSRPCPVRESSLACSGPVAMEETNSRLGHRWPIPPRSLHDRPKIETLVRPIRSRLLGRVER